MDKIVRESDDEIIYEDDLVDRPADLVILFDLGTPQVQIVTDGGQVLSISLHHDQSTASDDEHIMVCADLVEAKLLGNNWNEDFEPAGHGPNPFEIHRLLAKGDQVIGDDRAKTIQWTARKSDAR